MTIFFRQYRKMKSVNIIILIVVTLFFNTEGYQVFSIPSLIIMKKKLAIRNYGKAINLKYLFEGSFSHENDFYIPLYYLFKV